MRSLRGRTGSPMRSWQCHLLVMMLTRKIRAPARSETAQDAPSRRLVPQNIAVSRHYFSAGLACVRADVSQVSNATLHGALLATDASAFKIARPRSATAVAPPPIGSRRPMNSDLKKSWLCVAAPEQTTTIPFSLSGASASPNPRKMSPSCFAGSDTGTTGSVPPGNNSSSASQAP